MAAADGAPAGAPLVKLRDKSASPLFEAREEGDPRTSPEFFCKEPGRGVAWLYSDGSLGYVRCGAPNRCDYCSMITACENAVVLRYDSFDAGRRFPRVGITTTTRPGAHDYAALRVAEAQLWKNLRSRSTDSRIEYCGFLEWTTGRSERSRGLRLPHIHHVVKGLRWEDGLEAEISDLWRGYAGGAWRVECRPLRTPRGAVAYLVLHHHKREQGPPPGTRHTRRLRASRGYFERPISEYRAEAREVMRDERVAAGLVEALNLPGAIPSAHLDDLLVEKMDDARAVDRRDRPRLVHVREQAVYDTEQGEVRYEFREVLGLLREPRL